MSSLEHGLILPASSRLSRRLVVLVTSSKSTKLTLSNEAFKGEGGGGGGVFGASL